MKIKFSYQRFPVIRPSGHRVIGRPLIPVKLIGNGQKSRTILALIDSGCDTVIFPADSATSVGIKIVETGQNEPTIGVNGQPSDVYYHPLALLVLGDGRELRMDIGFSKVVPFPLLGRTFFAHFGAIVFAESFAESKEEVELVIS